MINTIEADVFSGFLFCVGLKYDIKNKIYKVKYGKINLKIVTGANLVETRFI